eukprot:2769883-Heterocapsa_arctica.AAC.1
MEHATGPVVGPSTGASNGRLPTRRTPRELTCFPESGEPKELDFFVVSHCLRNCVASYEAMPRGMLPTHRP